MAIHTQNHGIIGPAPCSFRVIPFVKHGIERIVFGAKTDKNRDVAGHRNECIFCILSFKNKSLPEFASPSVSFSAAEFSGGTAGPLSFEKLNLAPTLIPRIQQIYGGPGLGFCGEIYENRAKPCPVYGGKMQPRRITRLNLDAIQNPPFDPARRFFRKSMPTCSDLRDRLAWESVKRIS